MVARGGYRAMYIRQAPKSFQDLSYKEAMKRFIAAAEHPDARPCESCTKPRVAGDFCSEPCQHAAKVISSESDRYPIEPLVFPLVFALSRFNFIKPCWSCEGHNDQYGKLWKLPQVWFYTCSPCYAHLIGKFLWEMKKTKLIQYDWRVSLSAFGDLSCATYIIETALLPDNCELTELQLDLEVLANCFEAGVTGIAYRALMK